jgi:hypothetical protein
MAPLAGNYDTRARVRACMCNVGGGGGVEGTLPGVLPARD